ncbi:Immunity protein 49 [Williamwhitmania taraxaci]|uniref:Immunity protein 49 n=2 Tax=Williamwhitmania taraxaci TaxID=1640674 RepID=A0A1G6HBR1_9BACT|nr:Immunity protein 49 [Williamwhitmania taraxaci]
MLDAYCVINYQDRLFDYDIHSIGYAMLSDNLPFIKDVFAKLTYSGFYYEDKTYQKIPVTMEDNVLQGEGAIFTHTMQQFLLGNNALVERNLEIMERVYFSKSHENSTMQYDVNYFRALYLNDVSKCERILNDMVSPKIHQKRNDDALLKKYISMPALGYAKLAWLKGVEVEVKSKLIPKELLPISPLEKYEIPYDFLK